MGRAIRGRSASSASYHQLTFRKGAIFNARFAPDGQTYVYSASWEGSPFEIYMGRVGSPEARNLEMTGANLLAVSSTGEMALSVGARRATNLQTNGTLARAPLAGGAPREIAANVMAADWSPDGSSLAVARDVKGFFRLEYPLGTTLFETRGWITHLRVSPQGDKVAFMFHPTRGDDRGTVMVVDRNRSASTLSPEWSTEGGLAWSPTGREVWFTAGPGGNERSLFAATLSGSVRSVARVPGGITIHDIARDGRVLLAADEQRSDLCGLVAGDKRERDLTWLDFAVPADISPDGKTVLFTEQGSAAGHLYSVFVRGMDGGPATRLGDGDALAFSPDGKQVLSVLYTSPPKLVLLPTGVGEPRMLPNPGFEQYRDRGSRWTPDGENVVYAASERGKLSRCYVQNLKTGAVRPVTPVGIADFVLSMRGDSVYAGAPDGKAYAYPIRGGTPAPISVGGLHPGDEFIRLSPDGRLVFGIQRDENGVELFGLDIRTRRREPIQELKPADTAGLLGIPSVVISPDGRSIVFMARRYLSQLYLAEGLH
jgi:Tol biopolymer transport system component